MATILQLRRGTTVQHSSFTGAVGEVTVDTTKDTIVVHDGTTAGGVPLAKESAIADFITLADISGGTGLDYNSSTGVFDIDSTVATKTYVDNAILTKDNSDEITEGSTNLYFTNTRARGAVSVTDSGGDGSLSYNSTTGVITYTGPSASDVRAHFSAGTGITITNGAIATTITQYTDALARAAVSVTDSGGDGSLSYNSTTGVITYTGPTASDVRAHFSAGTGITITNGAVAVDSTIATKTYADNAATTAVAAVIDAAPATLDTLNELAAALGDDANFSTTITTSIGTKLNSSAVSAFGLTLIDDVDAAAARTTLGLGTAATTAASAYATSAQGTKADAALPSADFNSTFDTRLGTKSTTNLSEGTNLYYTDARARGALSAGTGISYNSTTGAIAVTNGVYTTDTGTVTNTMLAGSIANAKLTNSSVTIGSTSVSLGATATTLAGLTSVTATSFVGALTGNASTVTNGVYTTDTGTVTNTMLAGSIANAKLSNSAITLAGTSVSLGGSFTATNMLDAIKTVDGTGSGLDADLLDGQSSAYFRINIYDAAGTLLN